jgi:hypothetical protein
LDSDDGGDEVDEADWVVEMKVDVLTCDKVTVSSFGNQGIEGKVAYLQNQVLGAEHGYRRRLALPICCTWARRRSIWHCEQALPRLIIVHLIFILLSGGGIIGRTLSREDASDEARGHVISCIVILSYRSIITVFHSSPTYNYFKSFWVD